MAESQHRIEKKPEKPHGSTKQMDFGLGLEEGDQLQSAVSTALLQGVTPGNVLALQRMVGNQAVLRMMPRPIQPATRDERRDESLEAGQESIPRERVEPTIQRTPTPKISSYAASGGSTLIQRQMVLASKDGHFHEIEGPPSGEIKQKVKQIQKAKTREAYKRFDDLEIADDQNLHIKNGKGEVVWYRIAGTNGRYVLAKKVFARFIDKPTTKNVEDSESELQTDSKTDLFDTSGEIVNEVDNAMVDVLRGYTLKTDLRGEDLTTGETKTQTETNIAEGAFWAGGGAMGMLSGIFGMASSLKDLTNDENSTWEKVEAAFKLIISGSDIVSGSQGIVGGVAQLVNSQQAENTPESDFSGDISGWALGFQGMFSSLSNGIKTILDVVSLIRMVVLQVSDKETFDRDEWLAKVGSLLLNALETAKGVIMTFRVLWELINDSVTGAFEAVIPGFDIAVSAVKSIFQGYYLAESAYHWYQMAKSTRKSKKDLIDKGHDKKSIKQARKFYQSNEGLISNSQHRIDKNEKGIKKREKKLRKQQTKSPSRFKFVNNLSGNKMGKLRGEIHDMKQENREVSSRLDSTKFDVDLFENDLMDTSGELKLDPVGGGDDVSPAPNPTRMELSELNLSKELSEANSKRVVRQSVHIATNLAKIAGAIITIVGGTGAPAGVALKAAAAGVDLSLPFFRSLKQYGRKKAAKSQVKGKSNLTTKIFNANKSSVAKLEHRKRMAVTILVMVSDLNNMLPTSDVKNIRDEEREKLHGRVEHIERFMYAAGISPQKLYRENGKPAVQIKLLVEAMCKRELM